MRKVDAHQAQRQILPGISTADYVRHMRRFPRFFDVLDLRLDEDRPAPVNEFDSDVTGRGDSYRIAQRHCDVRRAGIVGLLERALGGPIPAGDAPGLRVLDVLGGDGTIARSVAGLTGNRVDPWILTGDISGQMTAEAVRYGIPAACQPAQRLALRSGTFDAVILAYGTHHIPAAERRTAFREACRVLKPGGRVVVHDFDQHGAVARWFEEVVDRYTPGGHRYAHFTEAGLRADLSAAGFTVTEVGELYDPFVMTAGSAERAAYELCSYVLHMYGLFKLREGSPLGWDELLWKLMSEFMEYPQGGIAAVPRVTVDRRGDHFVATMPRVALVATGTKP